MKIVPKQFVVVRAVGSNLECEVMNVTEHYDGTVEVSVKNADGQFFTRDSADIKPKIWKTGEKVLVRKGGEWKEVEVDRCTDTGFTVEVEHKFSYAPYEIRPCPKPKSLLAMPYRDVPDGVPCVTYWGLSGKDSSDITAALKNDSTIGHPYKKGEISPTEHRNAMETDQWSIVKKSDLVEHWSKKFPVGAILRLGPVLYSVDKVDVEGVHASYDNGVGKSSVPLDDVKALNKLENTGYAIGEEVWAGSLHGKIASVDQGHVALLLGTNGVLTHYALRVISKTPPASAVTYSVGDIVEYLNFPYVVTAVHNSHGVSYDLSNRQYQHQNGVKSPITSTGLKTGDIVHNHKDVYAKVLSAYGKDLDVEFVTGAIAHMHYLDVRKATAVQKKIFELEVQICELKKLVKP